MDSVFNADSTDTHFYFKFFGEEKKLDFKNRLVIIKSNEASNFYIPSVIRNFGLYFDYYN